MQRCTLCVALHSWQQSNISFSSPPTFEDGILFDNALHFLSFPQAQKRPTPLPSPFRSFSFPRTDSLDIARFDQAVDCYFQNSLAPSTQRSYASAQSRYLSFCSQFNIQPLRIHEIHLCRFASLLAKDNIAHVCNHQMLFIGHTQTGRARPTNFMYKPLETNWLATWPSLAPSQRVEHTILPLRTLALAILLSLCHPLS